MTINPLPANDNSPPWWVNGLELAIELHLENDAKALKAVSVVARHCDVDDGFDLRDISSAFANTNDVEGFAYSLVFSVTFDGDISAALLSALHAIGISSEDVHVWIAAACRALANVSDDPADFSITALHPKVPEWLSLAVVSGGIVGGQNV